MMTENKTDVFWLSEPGLARMIFVGPAYEEIWGRSRQSLYQSPGSHLDAIHPEDRERVMAALADPGRDKWELQYRIVRPDGSVRLITDRALAVRDREGKVLRVVGVATDITCDEQPPERPAVANCGAAPPQGND